MPMSDPVEIDLASNDEDLARLRSVLLRPNNVVVEEQQREIEQLRARISEMDDLRKSLLEFDALRARISELEHLVIDLTGRTTLIDEVLVDAVTNTDRETGELGVALQAEIEHAVHVSARADEATLADALYPVIGPAIRKMIAAMFTIDKDQDGKSFSVEQVLLIERSTGLMLASTATNAQALEDADVVSGMIDALTSFVQEAFAASANDGFSDLRVGDLTLLVETGPNAVLASVVRGIPSQDYRTAASRTLESIHVEYDNDLSNFDGSIDVFDEIGANLEELHQLTPTRSNRSLFAVFLVAMVVLVALLAIMGALAR